MVKAIVDKLKDAEMRAERLVKDAEAKAGRDAVRFEKEMEKRLRNVRAENEAAREKALKEAEELAKREETHILAEAQREVNALRASADKKKEEAVLLIIKKIVAQ